MRKGQLILLVLGSPALPRSSFAGIACWTKLEITLPSFSNHSRYAAAPHAKNCHIGHTTPTLCVLRGRPAKPLGGALFCPTARREKGAHVTAPTISLSAVLIDRGRLSLNLILSRVADRLL